MTTTPSKSDKTGPDWAISWLANRRTLVVSGVLFVLLSWLLFATSASFSIRAVEMACGEPPPDVRLYSSADDVQQFLANCGPAGREAYQNLQVADLVYPAVSGVFMASATAAALIRIGKRQSSLMMLSGLPLVGALFDYLENLAAWTALRAFPAPPTRTGQLLGLASASKQVTMRSAGLALVIVFVLAARRWPADVRSRWASDRVIVVELGDRIVMRPFPKRAIAELRGKYRAQGPDADQSRRLERSAERADEDGE